MWAVFVAIIHILFQNNFKNFGTINFLKCSHSLGIPEKKFSTYFWLEELIPLWKAGFWSQWAELQFSPL